MRKNQKEPTYGVLVTNEECRGDVDKMIRKFTKKVKKSGIIDELRERTHFRKPSELKTEEKRKRKALINKVNQKREMMLTNTRSLYNRRKK
tara:strand:- start:29 stop:301 length:273 start_codon:yes stop_codon:yes gene_type:complete